MTSQKGVVISQEKRCGVTDNVAAKSSIYIGGSINGGGTQNGWYIMKNLIKMDDLGVPLFQETSICHLVQRAKPNEIQEYLSRILVILIS